MNWFKKLFGIKEVEVKPTIAERLVERRETYNPIRGTSKTNDIDGHEITRQRLIKELTGPKGIPGRTATPGHTSNDYSSLMAIASMVNSSDNSNNNDESSIQGTGFHDGGFGGGDFSGSGSGGSWEDNSSSNDSSSYDSSSYDSSSSSDSSSSNY